MKLPNSRTKVFALCEEYKIQGLEFDSQPWYETRIAPPIDLDSRPLEAEEHDQT